MGPYLRIQDAVLLDHVICGTFTDYIWLGGDPYLDENVIRVSCIFGTIAKTTEICTYTTTTWSVVTLLFPFIRRINLVFILASPKS